MIEIMIAYFKIENQHQKSIAIKQRREFNDRKK